MWNIRLLMDVVMDNFLLGELKDDGVLSILCNCRLLWVRITNTLIGCEN